MKKGLLLALAFLAPVTVSLSGFSLDDLAGRANEAVQQQAAEYDLPPDMVEQAKELARSLGLSKANLSRYAHEGMKALGQEEYLSALGHFDKISAAGLSSGQSSAFEDLKVLVDAYVLRRNFEAAPGADGPLGEVLTALKGKDYAAASQQLQQAVVGLKPTGAQLQILTSLKDQYTAWASKDAL